jgi:pimeloyl-ACP methyl ester carboxylesterase
MSVAVVFVHGLWMTGHEAFWLRRRMARSLGAEDRLFSYSSVSATVAENAAALGRFLAANDADTVHLVGHSLGGVVILTLFEDGAFAAPPPPGRIVLLGSPVCGSGAARGFARWSFGRRMLGRGMTAEVFEPRSRRWDGARELGVIAGDRARGFGRLVGQLPPPNDGVVMVDETRLAGAKAQLVVHSSHSGMLFSDAVARHTAAFLRDGGFGDCA